MKRALIRFIAIVAILFIWDAVDYFMDASLSPMARAEKSLLVVYSKPDTNGIFVVQEIWKDTRKSHPSLIGLKLNKLKSGPHIQSPNGAVSFYEKESWFSQIL
jgi:hypothetical protein